MLIRKPSTRWALWVFAAALLLKSAMPFLAQASAQMQGKVLVEVCTVYGVSLVPLAGDTGDRPQPATEHGWSHAGDHCALTALAALATGDAPVGAPALVTLRAVAPPLAHPSPQAPDACASWVARLKHGPPTLS